MAFQTRIWKAEAKRAVLIFGGGTKGSKGNEIPKCGSPLLHPKRMRLYLKNFWKPSDVMDLKWVQLLQTLYLY